MKAKLSRIATLIDKYGLWPGLRIYLRFKFKPFGTTRVPGIRHPISLRKDSTDKAIFEQVFVQGDYDLAINFVPGVIVDAGANIGLFTILMKNRFPQAKVICIEPDPENVRLLEKNTAPYTSISVETAGLWHEDKMLRVFDKHNMGFSAMVTEESGQITNTRSITMDSLLKKYGLDRVDILKIDIEGSEEAVFSRNFENWLPKVKMIIIELHDWLRPGCSGPFFQAIQKSLRSYDYFVHNENTVIINRDLV